MRIDDGFQTLIEFSLDPTVKLWEKEVTPPGISNGGPTDTTTMRNNRWRTMAPKKLKTLTPCSFTAAYDPVIYLQLNAQMGINQIISIKFADNSRLRFWGWLDEVTPGAAVEGEQSTADCTIQPSNTDDNQDEVDPEYIDPDGNTNQTND